MKRFTAVLIAVIICLSTKSIYAARYLYVSSANSQGIMQLDLDTGTRTNLGISSNYGIDIGPDGNFYAASGQSIIKYDTTGNSLGVFASTNISGAHQVMFGPDGNLYVGNYGSSEITKYDGQTGAYLGVFASGHGMSQTDSLAFGPAGSVYVNSRGTSTIHKFDFATGDYQGIALNYGALGLPSSDVIWIGTDQKLYIGHIFTNTRFTRFNLSDMSMDLNIESPHLSGIALGPDNYIYTSHPYDSEIRKYDYDGNYITTYYHAFPSYIMFDPASRYGHYSYVPGGSEPDNTVPEPASFILLLCAATGCFIRKLKK